MSNSIMTDISIHMYTLHESIYQAIYCIASYVASGGAKFSCKAEDLAEKFRKN